MMRHRPRNLVTVTAMARPSVFLISTCGLCLAFFMLLALVASPALADDPDVAVPPASSTMPNTPPATVLQKSGEQKTGELKLEGVEPGMVERLTLEAIPGKQSPGNSGHVLEHPGAIATVPVGEYRIGKIELRGGYCSENRSGYVRPGSPLFKADATINANEPCSIKIGPLKQQLRVSREGQVMELAYQLVDSEGREYNRTSRDAPPSFTVYCDGQPVGSGTFAYG